MATQKNPFENQQKAFVKHQFIGDILRSLWVGKARDFNVIEAEIDCDGYDVAIRAGEKTRHIQLKFSLSGGKMAEQKINGSLPDLAGGCVVWIVLDADKMTPSNYLWLGKGPDEMLTLDSCEMATHGKSNCQGKKALRPCVWNVKREEFDRVASIDDLMLLLFPGSPVNPVPALLKVKRTSGSRK